MAESSTITRQLSLAQGAAFIQNLLAALRAAGVAEEQWTPLLETSVKGACVQCGIRLAAQELLEWAQTEAPPPTTSPNPRVARLRQGYCARHECQSYYYRFEFADHPGVNWPNVLAAAESADEQSLPEAGRQTDAQASVRNASQKKRMLRVLAGIGILLVLWLVRQWITGGTIPLIREPKQYRVAPASMP